MKKIVLGLAVLLSGFSLTSCEPWEDDSNNPDTTPTEEITLEGTWKLTALNLEEAYDFNGDGTSSTSLMSETNCYQNELMEFMTDYTGIATSNSYANVSIDGETFSVECIEEVEETTFVWNQTGNSVTLNVGGANIVATKTDNKLTYVIPEGFYASDMGEGGVEILQDITFVYTKQ